jgi:hypothetical protein
MSDGRRGKKRVRADGDGQRGAKKQRRSGSVDEGGDDPLDKAFSVGGSSKPKSNYKKKQANMSKTAQLGACTLDDVYGDDYVPVPLPSNERADAIFDAYDKTHNSDNEPSEFEFDSVPFPNTTGITPPKEKSGTFCFACDHVGEMTPAVADTEIGLLIENMMTGLITTELGRHCVNISQQYEERIRKKCNMYLRPGETPLPPWPPRMIKEHIESHHNDPTFTILLQMSKIKELTRVLFDCCLIKKKAPTTRKTARVQSGTLKSSSFGEYQYPDGGLVQFIGNEDGEEDGAPNEEADADNNADNDDGSISGDEEENVYTGNEDVAETGNENEGGSGIVVCPTVWKMIKETNECYIKLARSCPEKMAFFKEDRYLTKNGNVGHPFFNTKVNIFSASQRKNPSASNNASTTANASSKPQISNFLS